MTFSQAAALNVPAAAQGWLDGFCDTPACEAGHIPIGVGSIYALIWPGTDQGGITAMSHRLLRIGQASAVLPARPGQPIGQGRQTTDMLSCAAKACAAALHRHGHCRQMSLVLPCENLRPAAPIASLRAKHAARLKQAQALDEITTEAHDFLRAAGPHITAQLPPVACGSGKAARHLLVPKNCIADVAALWAASNAAQTQSALIGPLPPFAFINHAAKQPGEYLPS